LVKKIKKMILTILMISMHLVNDLFEIVLKMTILILILNQL